MISVAAPIFCIGECASGQHVSREMLAGIDPDIIAPLVVEHDCDKIVGCATAFRLHEDRLWSKLHIWAPRFINGIKRGDAWQLSATIDLSAGRFELHDVSLVREAFFGDRCALPPYRKAA